MSGGVLAIVISGAVLLCCVGPVVACFGLGGLGLILDEARPGPTSTVTSCQFDDNAFLPSATVGYRVTNNSNVVEDYTMDVFVLDASGTQVGEGVAFAFDVAAGSSVADETTVFLDAPGGSTCEIAEAG
jgi:hypothetical protein